MSANDHDIDYIAEALPAFIHEAQELIAATEHLLLQLEDAPGNRQLLDALFRCAHTIKGSAGIFGLDTVVSFTHHVETLLDHLRDGAIGLTPEISTLLLKCNDQNRRLIENTDGRADDAQAAAERAALVAELERLASPGTAPAPAAAQDATPGTGPRRWQVSARFAADTFRNGMDPLAILHYLADLGDLGTARFDTGAVPPLDALDPESCHLAFALDLQTARPRAAIEDAFSFVRDDVQLNVTALDAEGEAEAKAEAEAEAEAEADATAVATTVRATAAGDEAPAGAVEAPRYIRVQADRLDAVINLLGELVIASAGAALMARQSRQGPLVEATEQIGRLVEDIRNGTLQLRMVPIGETFSRFRRVVRDTAAELGKDVALEIVGGETELDKSVVERIADPLMHLVRNALDHGLEAPAQRQAAGKPPQGRLTLSACHESGTIVIRIDDDGRGIQRQRVLERAWERGLVERGVVPADAQILQLIFAPGFSTAERVTSLSGRGVGMDVVRSNIEALRGSVTIASDEGRGSTIEIRLPLTLAIIDGFLVGVGASKFIFPLDAVVEVIEDRRASTVLDARGRGVVELRDRALPVVSLSALYALEGRPPARCSIVVIQSGAMRCGVIVDSLLGQHQTVIKPLGRMFRSLRGISGSTILGNGEVALIVDVASLGQLAADASLPAPRPAPHGVAVSSSLITSS